jgi:hypothetical protein
VRSDLESAGRPAELSVTAADLAGYAEPDPAGTTFVRLAEDAGSGFDLVIFFGSRYDIAAAGDVEAAATAAFAAARAQGWLVGDAAAWMEPDGVRPTAEGHRYLADLIGPVVEGVLQDRG